MKLPRYPEGLFHRGHSGRRFGAADMPILRELRDCYRRMLAALQELRAEETEAGSLLAFDVIQRELNGKFEACGQVLATLERTAPAWRP